MIKIREFERKFLMNREDIPNYLLMTAQRVEIEQAYLKFATEDDPIEKRISKRGDEYLYTEKESLPGQMLERLQKEGGIPEGVYEILLARHKGNIVRKMRHIFPAKDARLEFDVFQGDLEGLILMEVEFPDDPEAARTFTPPDWFGPEVTNDIRYRNASLAQFGMPSLEISGEELAGEDCVRKLLNDGKMRVSSGVDTREQRVHSKVECLA